MADSRQFIKIITGVFVIFIVLKITEFLKTLPQCPCYAEKSGKTNNLDKIDFLQKSVIFIALVKIVHTIYTMYTNSANQSKESPYMLFMVFLTTIVYTFFIYNVYEHQKSAGSHCECADKWQQNVMYFQALIYALVVAMVFFLGLIMLSTGSIGDSNFKRVVVLLAVFITGLGIFSMYGGDMNIFVEHVMQNFSQIEGFEYRCPHNNKPPKTGYNCSEVACAKGYKKKECPLTCIKK
jgi:hypothetical protein